MFKRRVVDAIFPQHAIISPCSTSLLLCYHQQFSAPHTVAMIERTFLTPLENKNRKLAITTTTPVGSVLSTWVLGKYRSGEDHKITEAEGEDGRSISYTFALFECHLDGDESKKAFVRIHCQVPYIGTELDTVEEKRTQADGREPEENLELLALQKLQDSGVVPRLLAWQHGR
jgi:hypothetical protein